MTNYRLTYFDFDGGRAEPIRIAMHAAGIAFEDVRWSFSDFGENRQSLPFRAVPVLEIDGQVFTQSLAISRFIGKRAGLYPDDELQALYCDEVLGGLEDLNHYIVQTFGLKGDAQKQARQELVNGRLTVFVAGLADLLERGGGQYFSNRQLTIADLFMFVQTKQLTSGILDHIPADIVHQLAPSLIDHYHRVQQESIVLAYYAR
ncbi:MAG: glutathione S-transferase family protein [Granulosicoccus sp.]